MPLLIIADLAMRNLFQTAAEDKDLLEVIRMVLPAKWTVRA